MEEESAMAKQETFRDKRILTQRLAGEHDHEELSKMMKSS